jgi:hypothetical protein
MSLSYIRVLTNPHIPLSSPLYIEGLGPEGKWPESQDGSPGLHLYKMIDDKMIDGGGSDISRRDRRRGGGGGADRKGGGNKNSFVCFSKVCDSVCTFCTVQF